MGLITISGMDIGHEVAKNVLCDYWERGLSILEIGGQEWQMKKYFPSVKELDIDKRWKPDFLCDAEVMSKHVKQKFDVIFSSHFFEHVYEPERVLKECNKLLNKDGIIFFRVPVVDPDRLWLDGDKWNLHQHYFTRKNIDNLCKLSGFVMESFEVYCFIRPKFLQKFVGNLLHKGDIFFIARRR